MIKVALAEPSGPATSVRFSARISPACTWTPFPVNCTDCMLVEAFGPLKPPVNVNVRAARELVMTSAVE